MHLKIIGIAAIIVGLAGCSDNTIKESVQESHPNGTPKKVIYYKGSPKNLVRTVFYHPNGKIQSDSYFKDGVADSSQTLFIPADPNTKNAFSKLVKNMDRKNPGMRMVNSKAKETS
jgi:antitoxin component YwqK of YwqJK toxin-antitoxin module